MNYLSICSGVEAAARAIGVSVGHLYELRKLARD